jgi:phytoene/squalene synthetase
MAVEQFNQSPKGHPPTAAALKAEIETWQVEITRLGTLIAGHQMEFRLAPDRDRAEQLMAELLQMTAELMAAREAIARLGSELSSLRSLRSSSHWWWRMMMG